MISTQPVRIMSENRVREEIRELELLLQNGEMSAEEASRLTELKIALKSINNHRKPTFP